MDLKRLPKTEFAQAVAQIAGERNIDPQLILDSIEAGLISAYKRNQKEHGIVIPTRISLRLIYRRNRVYLKFLKLKETKDLR